MPVYAYQCKSCGNRFDRQQSFKEDSIKVCPTCGGETYRVISAAGVIFKGSGYYINDSKAQTKSTMTSPSADKSEASESSAKTETPAASASDSKNESKTESKQESKSEVKPETKTESKPTATPAAS